MIRLILAVDQGNAVGWSDGRLPWSLSNDMRRFKQLTTGGTVVMGLNTFFSLNRPAGLPNRKNIVLTTLDHAELAQKMAPTVILASSFEQVQSYDEPVWLIGGAQVADYALSNDLVDEIYLTIVHEASDADVRLQTDLAAWKSFVLKQAKHGICWRLKDLSVQPDGEYTTSYVNLSKLR